jgi:mannose-1-phosphate guanylyltransferase/mannose-6-phosphate isomerase
MATIPNHYFIILCGGTGPRLWPLSKANHPKQFIKIFNDTSLLQETVNRVKKITSTKNIFIVTNKRYVDQINTVFHHKFDKDHIISEPAKKNTAMAIILAMVHIKKLDPNAIITSMPSDHFIQGSLKFKKTIKYAGKLAFDHQSLVTIGIKPTNPNPSYGYISIQQKKSKFNQVSLFIEKPSRDMAQILIKKGSFWNSGIYTFTIPSLIAEFKKIQPEYFTIFEKLESKIGDSKSIENIYKNAPDLAIDRAISEKTDNMLVIPAKFYWSDVGEWKSIYQNLKKDNDGHANINHQTKFLSLNSKNCLINGLDNKLIGLVGVNNLAIIDTPDSLLICNLDQSANVRDLVTLIVKQKKYQSYFLKK